MSYVGRGAENPGLILVTENPAGFSVCFLWFDRVTTTLRAASGRPAYSVWWQFTQWSERISNRTSANSQAARWARRLRSSRSNSVIHLSTTFQKHFYFLFLFFFPPQAEAVESIHQACPVWLQWQRAPIRGPIGGPVASHQTSTELQLSPPDTENSLELASTQPTPVHRSKLTLTHTVCTLEYTQRSYIFPFFFFFCKMAVVKNRRDVRLLPIVSDDQSHPDSVEHLHTPPSH